MFFEQEYFPEDELIYEELPYTVELEDGMYIVEGPKIEKCLDIQILILKKVCFLPEVFERKNHLMS